MTSSVKYLSNGVICSTEKAVVMGTGHLLQELMLSHTIVCDLKSVEDLYNKMKEYTVRGWLMVQNPFLHVHDKAEDFLFPSLSC